MKSDKFLIINADDFGWTEGINEGIIEAHQNGILTSATLLAGARATNHAVRLALDNPTLGVGAHLAYNLGSPLLSAADLDAIYHPDGRPRFSTPQLWLAVSARPKVRYQLYCHFRSQIEHLLRRGIRLDHLDTHKHLHFWPAVFSIVARLAVEFNIPALRLIRENPFDPGPITLKTRTALIMLSWTVCVNMLRASRLRRICPHRLIGIIQTGYWTDDYFLNIVKILKPGVTEIMMHPGYTQGLENETTRLIDSRLAELKVLTDPQVKELFQQCHRKIRLIGFQDLPDLTPDRLPPAAI